ncbi:EAL domain-containing protein [Pediococcus cellicola]|uniref:C-di-GMP-specific phosphodiesterase n=1 Tax=Pediococcus cellicola TaxID=319652 RepID=A0A0R2IYL9_9LACO|nr:EAL domain-containing protein [Pediococcus cellicola]KRN66970.1 C-di-GMP-specific phosphodiesterase [Pediococcus cellicola]GEL15097.1 diguanylate cyclase [Pediococcus cellicola]
MIRFWGQPRFSRKPLAPVGYELFIREGSANNWKVPNDFSKFTADQICELLMQTTPRLPKNIQNISINLDIDQFIDPKFCQTLFSVKNKLAGIHLAIELTEHATVQGTTEDQLIEAARRYNSANLYLILDDVGSGDNQLKRVQLLDPYVHEYKFAVQNFRPGVTLNKIMPKLTFWHELAKKNHKLFTIEGVESKEDLLILSHYQVDMLQGYVLGRPVYLPTQNDPLGSIAACSN